MSYDSENLDCIVAHLRAEITPGDWLVYTARRIATETGLSSHEVGYWLGRINGSHDGVEPMDVPGLKFTKWNPGASSPLRWKIERVAEDSSERAVADGGVRWIDLREIQQQLVKAIIELENDGDVPYGLAIKEVLSERYGKEVGHGQLYPNLDDLVEMDVVEKGEIDRRTNSYASTGLARAMVAGEAEHMAHLAGLEVSEAVADGGEFQLPEGTTAEESSECPKCGSGDAVVAAGEVYCWDCGHGHQEGEER
ncbi:DNA-binding protein [Haloferax mediterranei ATCC 33500]|uniref:DNA binding domain-containing protein n=1 Tax=Haloferax mediterranei (strain ATCC 33500 / DSM 1411 / JCM 8866 / NBRC 14739 / NCIMB 2177 / R-4) TaxID=523841 RepID=I3R482_HALMT|nr:DNA binding domain-containing protein [Haloferax mediterranei ATCC 33500]AHZ21599.1 DNA-binding protein [Haloferax mediterranei ATCC 33500]EMA03694.1 DNA binding domain-containing protein [Haloferax mediterranei ATCC 33500]QCQ75516.1 DNA-binding protein [Haloferax mediterranei ATCC 33500]